MSRTRTTRHEAATPARTDFTGWKKLPAKAPDGTPYCYECRRYYGELHLTEPGPPARCTAYGMPIYTVHLTYEQARAGAPCPGCGIAYTDKLDAPDAGPMYYTGADRATAIAEDRRYREAHARCHAGQWAVGGRTHCGRCCPPPPMSPDQYKSLASILHDSVRRRVEEARRVGRPSAAEPDPRERKLSGKATALQRVRREYEKAYAKVKEKVPQDEWPLLWWHGYSDPDELYRWRIQLDCGCVQEVTSVGDDPVPPDKTWRHPLSKVTLAAGQYYHRHGSDPPLGPYRLITHWISGEEYVEQPEPPGAPDWWRSSSELWEMLRIKEAHVYTRWTVRLECGHLGKTLSEPDWKPGGEPLTSVERAERLRVRIEADGVFADEPDERAHWLRMIELDLPSPKPEMACSDCEGIHVIVFYERVGWLVPPPVPPKARQRTPRTLTREELLQNRIKELEAENARLKGEQSGG